MGTSQMGQLRDDFRHVKFELPMRHSNRNVM